MEVKASKGKLWRVPEIFIYKFREKGSHTRAHARVINYIKFILINQSSNHVISLYYIIYTYAIICGIICALVFIHKLKFVR